MVNRMTFDFAEFARRCRSFKGVSLLIMLIAAALNFATGNYPFGSVFLALAIVFAVRLARQDQQRPRR